MKKLANLLVSKNLRIATAESCTGGLFGYTLSKIPGASQYYMGTITAYNNSVKKNILNVSNSIFENNLVISKDCVIEMINGLKSIIKANIYIAITGNAGPSYNKQELKGTTYYAIQFNNYLETGTIKILNMERTNIQKIIVTKIREKIIDILKMEK